MKLKISSHIGLLTAFLIIFLTAAAIVSIVDKASTSAETWDYQWLGQVYNISSQPDTTNTSALIIKNTGNTTWTNNIGANQIKLGTYRPRDRTSNLYDSSWISNNRVASFDGKATLDGNGNLQFDGGGSLIYDAGATTIAPGEVAYFTFTFKTPNQPYIGNEYFNLVVDGKQWLKDIGIFWPVNIGQGYAAEYVGQGAYPTVDKGINPTTSIYFDYKNTGSFNWKKNGVVRIGTSRNQDRGSGFYASILGDANQPGLPTNTVNWLGSNRTTSFTGRVTSGVLDTSATIIAPGETARFVIPIDARSVTAGSYREYFQPVADGFAWLVDVGAYQDITVQNTGTKVAAAGDIACDPNSSFFNGGAGTVSNCRMSSTADLIVDGSYAKVLLLGDNQYEDGTLTKYQQSYDDSWGAFYADTYPSPGNHEYQSGNANGYYSYFGAAAGDPTKGYYSVDIGTWHVIALNSNCSYVGGCQAGSTQEQWLRADLAANPDACTLAFWHHPRFSSGPHNNDATYDAFWDALYEYDADVILNGHDHVYERFSRQTPDAVASPADGIREFVVGTGGKNLTSFTTVRENSAARENSSFGVLSLRLSPYSYEWQFIPTFGSYNDSGSTPCH